VYPVENQPTFRRNISTSSSCMKSGSVCYLLHVNFFLGLFFYPEDGRDMTTQLYISEDRNLPLLFIVQESWW
jgi:hypothetical protein